MKDLEAISMRQLRHASILWFLFAMCVAGAYLALCPIQNDSTHVTIDHSSD